MHTSFNKNKKGYTLQYNFFTFLAAPLFVERCNYNAMIEYVTIRKLCTFKKNNFNK